MVWWEYFELGNFFCTKFWGQIWRPCITGPVEKATIISMQCVCNGVRHPAVISEATILLGTSLCSQVSAIHLKTSTIIDARHSVESPSMVDPQWDIWYWGSKWNLHTDCWSAVGCEWGTISVYFGITYVCFIPIRLPVFAVEPQYLLQDFLFLSKVSFEGNKQNLDYKKKWLSCERLPYEVFFSCLCDGPLGIAYANMLATTQWPLERAAHRTSLVWVCVLWLPESLMDLSALWHQSW